MGCSASKLDGGEVVQLCKERKRFIEQAVEQRIRFASGHIAYIQSLKRVSAALCNYVDGDEPHQFCLDSYATSPFTPIKKTSPVISSPVKCFPTTPISETKTSFKVNYLRSGGNQAVTIEERPQSPMTMRIESYSPIHHFEIGSFFAMQSSPMNSSTCSSSPNNRPNFPHTSPSQWDSFWNPFLSLEAYGYPTQSSLDHISELIQVREEKEKPVLDEDAKKMTEEGAKTDSNCANEAVTVEEHTEKDNGADTKQEMKALQSQVTESNEVSKVQNTVELTVGNQETAMIDQEAKEETPGFTVYVDPKTKMEVIKDLETQFTIVCNSANEVSAMLDTSGAQYSSASNELRAMRMLNPVALLRSASSKSPSSRVVHDSFSKDESCENSSNLSEESCSHQSTLEKLYAWEKKLYEEVKSGARAWSAYKKKCLQLKNQEAKKEDPSVIEKTRAAITDLHTQIKVSIHSVEAISKRIKTLRDEELQPQLLQLVQGLERMWKVMAECHLSQKNTIDEAKLLLAGPAQNPADPKHTQMAPIGFGPYQFARSAANLETELRNWQACFATWIESQRSYVHALTGWLLRCVQPESITSKLPFSPRHAGGAPPILGICVQWSRFFHTIREILVIDGLDFFAAGVGSLYTPQQLRESPHRSPARSKGFQVGCSPDSCGNSAVEEVALAVEEEVIAAKKMPEMAIVVLCSGMSVVMTSLTEFAIGSAEGYANLVKQWENTTCTQGDEQV